MSPSCKYRKSERQEWTPPPRSKKKKITDDDVAEAQRTIDRVKRKDLAAGQDGHEEEREEVEDPSDQLEALSL